MTPKIIHVCGTMGSGKTTLIRGWMYALAPAHGWEPLHADDRLVGYLSGSLHVMGPYVEGLQTSGCDAMKDTATNYRLIEESWCAGRTVVYEGLFMMNHTRGLELWNRTKAVNVLRLATSLEEAKAGVVARRAAQGSGATMCAQPTTRSRCARPGHPRSGSPGTRR